MDRHISSDLDIAVERWGAPGPSPRMVVAVPVKNEEERIGLCLEALSLQDGIDFAELAVVLLLNNCTDDTAERVRALAPMLPFRLELHAVTLPPDRANAGWARKLAMDAAARLVADDGLILTTDADTLAHEDWIAANRREIESGHDAVAGYVMADPMELMQLPPAILERGSLEWEYQQLAAELDARADPEPHDAWPRHNQNCGASAAVTAAAYRAIGGLPPRPVGEDRALFEMLRRIDGRIRHSLDVQVVTSARTDGRALGGLADEIRLRTDPDHPCDDALEVAMSVFRRAHWRGRLRALWLSGQAETAAAEWARRLRIEEADFRAALGRHPYFGAFWSELEGLSPRLAWRLVTMAGLKREIRRIRRLVDTARARGKAAVAAQTRTVRAA
jgi:cellulose synthase/poly-beta-1,6-N-acetylglucosamine synthase-like glycosyltransferase